MQLACGLSNAERIDGTRQVRNTEEGTQCRQCWKCDPEARSHELSSYLIENAAEW